MLGRDGKVYKGNQTGSGTKQANNSVFVANHSQSVNESSIGMHGGYSNSGAAGNDLRFSVNAEITRRERPHTSNKFKVTNRNHSTNAATISFNKS